MPRYDHKAREEDFFTERERVLIGVIIEMLAPIIERVNTINAGGPGERLLPPITRGTILAESIAQKRGLEK